MRGILILEGFLLSPSLVVSDVLAVSLPTDICHLGILDGIDQGSHTLIVGGIWLHEVDQIESIGLIFPCVFDSEVIPLAETLSTIIILEVAFVFKRSNFHDLS